MVFNAIAKLSPEAGQPFFKILSMLVDIIGGGPPGLPNFTPIILQRIWEVSNSMLVNIIGGGTPSLPNFTPLSLVVYM